MALAAKDQSTLAQTEARKVETKPNGTTENDQEQDIQQEVLSPGTKARAEHSRNPFTSLGSPSKISSFKNISKQSLIAHLQKPAFARPQADSKAGSNATRFRTSLTSMLIRRSKPDPMSTSEASSPFAVASSVNALKKSPREKADEPPVMPSKPETKIAQEDVVEEQKQNSSHPAEEVAQQQEAEITRSDKSEPEPEQPRQNSQCDSDMPEKEEEEESKQEFLQTALESKDVDIQLNSDVKTDHQPTDSPFETAVDVVEQQKNKNATNEAEKLQDDTASPPQAADLVSNKPQSNVRVGGKQRRNKKQTRFSVPLAMPLPSDGESDATQVFCGFQQNSARGEQSSVKRSQNYREGQSNRRDTTGRESNGGRGGKQGNKRQQNYNNGSKQSRGGTEEGGYGNSRNSETNNYGRSSNANNGGRDYGSQNQRNSNPVHRGDRSNQDGARYYNNHGNQSNRGSNNKDQMSYVKYKTSLCRHFEETGTCSLGDACSFAHGGEEKRGINDPMPEAYPGRHYVGAVHSNYKTQVCRNFEQTGMCKFQDNCCFAHGHEQLRNLTDPLPPIPREVLLYCPPNMKLLPSHGNIQIIPPHAKQANSQVQLDCSNQGMGMYFDGQQQDQGYPMAQDEQQQYYNPMQAQFYQNGFGHDPQQYMPLGAPMHQQIGVNAFGDFNPPGQQDPMAHLNNNQQFSMPLPYQQYHSQPQDEGPMIGNQHQFNQGPDSSHQQQQQSNNVQNSA